MIPANPDALEASEEEMGGDVAPEEAEAVIRAKLSDRRWRLNNLYFIQTKDKGEQVFKLNAAQEKMIEEMHWRNVLLKARQMGFTTFYCLFALDLCLFNDNINAGFIAHNKEDAEDIFTKKIRFAWDRLPDWLRQARWAEEESKQALRFNNGSSLRVGVSLRSGTYHFLHVSEFGKIAFKYPDKATEVVTGAFPTVPVNGFICVESTFEGGKGGEFYKLLTKSMESVGQSLGPLDFKFHFRAWWEDAGYRSNGEPAPELRTYFAELAEQGIKLDRQQMAWYSGMWRTLGNKMQQEYPSTPEEAMNVEVEGAYYGKLMTQARAQGRVSGVPWEPSVPVSTFWDLGIDDSMSIWFAQFVGREIRLIRYVEATGEGFGYFKRLLDDLRDRHGYNYGQHFAPHDISVREMSTGMTRLKSAKDLGINFDVVPIIPVDVGIGAVRDILSRCWFDKKACEQGVNCLEAYHAKLDETRAVLSPIPVHDWASHGADAFRTMAVAMKRGQIRDNSRVTREENERRRAVHGMTALSGMSL